MSSSNSSCTYVALYHVYSRVINGNATRQWAVYIKHSLPLSKFSFIHTAISNTREVNVSSRSSNQRFIKQLEYKPLHYFQWGFLNNDPHTPPHALNEEYGTVE